MQIQMVVTAATTAASCCKVQSGLTFCCRFIHIVMIWLELDGDNSGHQTSIAVVLVWFVVDRVTSRRVNSATVTTMKGVRMTLSVCGVWREPLPQLTLLLLLLLLLVVVVLDAFISADHRYLSSTVMLLSFQQGCYTGGDDLAGARRR